MTFFNISVALFHGILFLISADVGSKGCSTYDPKAKIYFTFFYYPILSDILPLIVSSLSSLLAYRHVRRIIRRQIPLTRRRLDHQMTAIALARAICIVILGVPFIVFSLVSLNISYDGTDNIKGALMRSLAIVTHTLVYTNFCISYHI